MRSHLDAYGSEPLDILIDELFGEPRDLRARIPRRLPAKQELGGKASVSTVRDLEQVRVRKSAELRRTCAVRNRAASRFSPLTDFHSVLIHCR